jgi:hypothetical protein
LSVAGVLVVDPGEVGKAVAAFQVAAADASAAAATAGGLAGGGPAMAPVWGSDPLGQAFGDQYVPVAQSLAAALEAVAQLFDAIAGQLADAIAAFAAAEERNYQLASGL